MDALIESVLEARTGDGAISTTLTLDAAQQARDRRAMEAALKREKDRERDREDGISDAYSSYFGYSLSHSAKTAQTLKKTFVKGFWPPANLNIGSNSESLLIALIASTLFAAAFTLFILNLTSLPLSPYPIPGLI